MAERRAIAGIKVHCEGAYQAHPLEKPVEATITVYENGGRDVGCPKIGRQGEDYGVCKALPDNQRVRNNGCVHLYPKSNQEET